MQYFSALAQPFNFLGGENLAVILVGVGHDDSEI